MTYPRCVNRAREGPSTDDSATMLAAQGMAGNDDVGSGPGSLHIPWPESVGPEEVHPKIGR